ncbi:MAG: hypothetical protein WC716_04400 [Chitinophagaceae bacterium]
MSWSTAKAFGVIKCDGNRVHLHNSRDNYNTIVVNENVQDARWAGDAVVVYLNNGKVRRYTSIDNYSNV